MSKDKWIWLPHCAPFTFWKECNFRLSTVVNNHIICTIGEWQHPDGKIMRLGDSGFYETCIYRAEKCITSSGMDTFKPSNERIGFKTYQTNKEALEGHLIFCDQYDDISDKSLEFRKKFLIKLNRKIFKKNI